MEFAQPFMTDEIARLSGVRPGRIAYPVFSFRVGEDLWVFCDFENIDMNPICDAIESDPEARHVFLCTHGPFTAHAVSGTPRWRLGGRHGSEATRPRLYEVLSRRHAIVLSGHTHTTNFYHHENRYGGFTEFTANSVWARPELATAVPDRSKVGDYAANPKIHKGDRLKDAMRDMAFFKPGLKEYFNSRGAGHYRMDVSDDSVTMSFYPGAARTPARTFKLA
jgi:hypothetical protein